MYIASSTPAGALMVIDVETRRPKISNVVGGLSGPAIRPIAVRMVYECRQTVKIPVIGNGDVRSVADIDRIKAQTGCDAVMIGRAAIGNPWIFQRKNFADVTFAERAALIRQHLAAMVDHYGPHVGIVLFRKHVVKYIKGVPYASDVRLALLTCNTADEFIELFSQWEERYEREDYHGVAEDAELYAAFESCAPEPAA